MGAPKGTFHDTLRPGYIVVHFLQVTHEKYPQLTRWNEVLLSFLSFYSDRTLICEFIVLYAVSCYIVPRCIDSI